jgi:serpin B
MNRNTLWGTFAVILLLGLAVLSSKQEASSISSLNQSATAPKLMASQPDQLNQLVNANNRFGFALFAQLQPQKSEPQNVFISPQSIAIALAMTHNGTAETTQTEMTQVLGLEQFDAATVNASYAELIKTLNSADGDLQLAIANSVWVNQNISLKQQFIKATQDFYQGSVTNLDFSNPSAKN